MKIYKLQNDVILFCVTARSFPYGIIEAFQTLEKMHPSICERPFYGISFQNKTGDITYKAAVREAFIGEGEKYSCETFVIPEGEYLTETILNFMESLGVIPNSFRRLAADLRVDKNFPCIEWYKSSKEMMCMVRMDKDPKNIKSHGKTII